MVAGILASSISCLLPSLLSFQLSCCLPFLLSGKTALKQARLLSCFPSSLLAFPVKDVLSEA
jgi:hypothetical protein